MIKDPARRVKAARNARLRAQAAIAYISDPRNPSIEQLSQDPRFTGVSVRTLERWSRADGWSARRQEFVEKWLQIARDRLGTRMAKDRIAELDLLDEVRDAGMERIRDGMVVPKSLEGVMRAVVDAIRYKDDLRQKIGDDVLQGVGNAASQFEPIGGYSKEELNAAARRILQMRRGTQQQIEPGEPELHEEEDDAEVLEPINAEAAPVRSETAAGDEEGGGRVRLCDSVRSPDEGGAGRGCADGEVETSVASEQAQFDPVPGS